VQRHRADVTIGLQHEELRSLDPLAPGNENDEILVGCDGARHRSLDRVHARHTRAGDLADDELCTGAATLVEREQPRADPQHRRQLAGANGAGVGRSHRVWSNEPKRRSAAAATSRTRLRHGESRPIR
jgi:hypothetical protein